MMVPPIPRSTAAQRSTSPQVRARHRSTAGLPVFVFVITAAQFNRLPVRRMEVGFRPCLFAFASPFWIAEPLRDDQTLQGREPMFIIVCAVVRLAATFGSLQL